MWRWLQQSNNSLVRKEDDKTYNKYWVWNLFNHQQADPTPTGSSQCTLTKASHKGHPFWTRQTEQDTNERTPPLSSLAELAPEERLGTSWQMESQELYLNLQHETVCKAWSQENSPAWVPGNEPGKRSQTEPCNESYTSATTRQKKGSAPAIHSTRITED